MTSRQKEIESYINNLPEYDTSDNIIKKITTKYKILRNYDYIRTEQLELGMIIRAVHLDLSKMTIPGFIMQIEKDDNGIIKRIGLLNKHSKTYWKFKPGNYYLFMIEKGNASNTDKIVDLYTRIKK